MKNEFLEEIYALVKKDVDDDHALDRIFEHFDALIESGDFKECNGILGKVDLEKISPCVMVSFLMITRLAKKKIIGWQWFMEKVRMKLETVRGHDVTKRLLAGM